MAVLTALNCAANYCGADISLKSRLISPTSKLRYAFELLKYTTRENHDSTGRAESTGEETQNEDGLQDLQVSVCFPLILCWALARSSVILG